MTVVLAPVFLALQLPIVGIVDDAPAPCATLGKRHNAPAFFSVSVEDAPRVAERNAVNTLPTIIIYAIGGKSALGVLVGATSLSRLRKVVEEALAKSRP